jgi:indoleacetamide hydrolase
LAITAQSRDVRKARLTADQSSEVLMHDLTHDHKVPTSKASAAADKLADLGVAAAAAAIRYGNISSEAYTSALLQRAKTHSALNAFITIDETATLAAARDADKSRAAGSAAPLLGVPLAIKDSYLTRGLPTTLGLEGLSRFVPEEDADAVNSIKAAGAIVFGKSNLVEMSFGLTGNNAHYGQVKNPHNRAHISGGSSSGSSAAVAARVVPASLGGDTVGSIRVPASLCGVVGFKPTTGRWPRNGVAPISHTLDTTGVFARSVEDCALIDHVVTGEGDSAPRVQFDLRGARLAHAPRQYLDLVDPEIETQFKDLVRRLREAGAAVTEVDLGADFSSIAATTWIIFFHETMGAISEFLRRHEIPTSFDEIYNGLKPDLKELWGQRVLPSGPESSSPEVYQTALSVHRTEIQRRFNETFAQSGAGALLFPTTPCTAPSIEHQWKFTIADQEVSYLVLAKNTVPASGAGLPGISLPIGLSSRRLPIGLEIDAPRAHDRGLLDLAQRVQAVVGALPAPA